MSETIDTIRADHRNFWRVLEAMGDVVEGLGEPPTRQELDIIYSAIYYMRVYPDRHHHPKEEDYLFAALRTACPESAKLLGDIESEHSEGEALLKRLETELRRVESGVPDSRAALRTLARQYIDMQSRHMRREESEVLPLAEQHVSDAEWARIDGAFRADRDPVFQDPIERGFDALVARLLSMVGTLRRRAG